MDSTRHLIARQKNSRVLNPFPAFCALIAGGSTALPILIQRLSKLIQQTFQLKSSPLSSRAWAVVVRFVAVFVSASLGFQVLNQKRSPSSQTPGTPDSHGESPVVSDAPESDQLGKPRPELAGRTLDLSFFAVTRAADVLVNLSWDAWKHRRKTGARKSTVQDLAQPFADAGVFAVSSAIVMWAWFYLPERLPASYRRWIDEAAQVDSRLIETLRRARRGTWVYGKDTGQAYLLESMCEDYGWPLKWGDPAQTVPIPCEMVHMGCGPNCEKHALMRFVKTFKFACATYLPLQLALRWRSRSIHAFTDASKNAVRSSAFLGLFVSIFYYSICLSRNRLGPKIFSPETVTPMMWDSGLDVGAACAFCGWSILAENPKKRQEIAFFVAPRALATLFPRRYERKYQWRESLAFSLSTAVVLTAIQERPEMVRGFMGRLLGQVFQ
ncbi:hypothetical protein FQN54_004195 [Arachnomyces sp. PD_36]|nr:hypothetical protein FQN54_004195 [Arachnomyces sp. PD_36]